MLFALVFSLLAAVVNFAAASYVIGHYRRCYEEGEIKGAFVIGTASFLFLVTMFYGPYLLWGTIGQGIIASLLIIIVMATAVIVRKVLTAKKFHFSRTR